MYANAIPMGRPFNKVKCIEDKLKMLSQICITLTATEMAKLNTLNTPRQIEAYIRDIIDNHLC
jgi:hypothetical protein